MNSDQRLSRCTLGLLLAGWALVLFSPTASFARSGGMEAVSWWGFQTPSHNIVCNSGTPGMQRLDCAVFSASDPRKGQKTWTLNPTGRPRARYVAGNIGTDVAVLGYGRVWRRGTLSCVSRITGLTCQNRGGTRILPEP